MKSLLLSLFMFAFISEMPQAQVLKRSHKKDVPQSEQIVSNAILFSKRKILDRNQTISTKENLKITDISKVPDTYNFDWSYNIKIETKDGETFLNYLIEKNQLYYGMKISSSENIFMVLDPQIKLMIMFMETEGKKWMNTAQYNYKKTNHFFSGKKSAQEKYKFKKVGNKTIVGYSCKGYQVENNDQVITFYITSEPDINFKAIYQLDKTHLPENFNPDWLNKAEGVLMQMSMEGIKHARNNMTLTCIKLSKEQHNFDKIDYLKIAED